MTRLPLFKGVHGDGVVAAGLVEVDVGGVAEEEYSQVACERGVGVGAGGDVGGEVKSGRREGAGQQREASEEAHCAVVGGVAKIPVVS